MLRSDNQQRGVAYESEVRLPSLTFPGVHFTVLRMSFGRKMDLLRRIREVAGRLPFLEASGNLLESVEANLLSQAIDELYVRWGLARVEGLTIDGREATMDLLLECGPDELMREVVTAIKSECGLSDEERKN